METQVQGDVAQLDEMPASCNEMLPRATSPAVAFYKSHDLYTTTPEEYAVSPRGSEDLEATNHKVKAGEKMGLSTAFCSSYSGSHLPERRCRPPGLSQYLTVTLVYNSTFT